MGNISLCSAINNIYGRPELVIEDRLRELLESCIEDLNNWDVCGQQINNYLEQYCFTGGNDSNENLMFSDTKMKLFYSQKTKKASLEVCISDKNTIKMFLNIIRLKRLSNLSVGLEGKTYPLEIYKYGDKKKPLIKTQLIVDHAKIVNDGMVVLFLTEV